MAYFVAHLGVENMLFLHFLNTIQACPLITFEKSCQKCLFDVKGITRLFFGVSLLVSDRNPGNSEKVSEILRKSIKIRAIYCVVGFYLSFWSLLAKGEDLAIEMCQGWHFVTS